MWQVEDFPILASRLEGGGALFLFLFYSIFNTLFCDRRRKLQSHVKARVLFPKEKSVASKVDNWAGKYVFDLRSLTIQFGGFLLS